MDQNGSPRTLDEMTLEDVGQALGRNGWRLSFEPALEGRFEADTADERCRKLVRHNHVGLAIYNAFLLGDWLLIRDIFTFSVILHLAIMSPIMVLLNLTISRRPNARLRESLLAGGIVLGTAAILLLTLMSRSPLRSSEHLSVVLVILFATMVQRIRFRYVVAACVACMVLYVLALGQFFSHDPARVMVADSVLAGVVLFSLIGSYNLEAELRTGYLLSLRDRLRNEELERISCRDALTGVGNRRALDIALQRLDARPSVATMLLVDIDYFKNFNDANGHLAGDDCLRHVADLIARDRRIGRDRVFRFGGEEFLILLENVSTDEADVIGEGLRLGVQAAAIRRGHSDDAVVTVSIGIAGRRSASHTAARLMAEADAALYEAKRAGRNRAVSRREPPPPACRAA